MVHFEGWCRKKGALFSVSYIMTPEKAQTIHETSILCTSFDPIKNQPFIGVNIPVPWMISREGSLMFFFELYFLRDSNLGQTPAPRGSKLMKFFSVIFSGDRFWGTPKIWRSGKTNLWKNGHVNSPSPRRPWRIARYHFVLVARLENRVNACI